MKESWLAKRSRRVPIWCWNLQRAQQLSDLLPADVASVARGREPLLLRLLVRVESKTGHGYGKRPFLRGPYT
jgi:hypothetical protein